MFAEEPTAGRCPSRPVLYLDLDDTLVSWTEKGPRSARGARDFVLWARDLFEVRWLTTWCPSGVMEPELLGDLCRMLEIETHLLADIRGIDWEPTDSKLNGIAWLEHLVLGRPFLWIEDQYGVGERELAILRDHGLAESYRHCNVTEDPDSLASLHDELCELYDLHPSVPRSH